MKALKLLIAAATLAVGVSAQAAVYSQNVVGYVNITIPAGKYQMVANQMDTGSNYLNNIFPDGSPSSSQFILMFNPTNGSFRQYVWYNSDDSLDSGTGWYDLLNNNPATNVKLDPGMGCFYHNTDAGSKTLTTLGSVASGTNVLNVRNGFQIYSLPVPVGGQALDAQGFPGTSSSDFFLRYNQNTDHFSQLVYYNSDDSLDGNTGWYDLLTNVAQDTNSAAWPVAGEAFYINHAASAVTWTNVFILP